MSFSSLSDSSPNVSVSPPAVRSAGRFFDPPPEHHRSSVWLSRRPCTDLWIELSPVAPRCLLPPAAPYSISSPAPGCRGSGQIHGVEAAAANERRGGGHAVEQHATGAACREAEVGGAEHGGADVGQDVGRATDAGVQCQHGAGTEHVDVDIVGGVDVGAIVQRQVAADSDAGITEWFAYLPVAGPDLATVAGIAYRQVLSNDEFQVAAGSLQVAADDIRISRDDGQQLARRMDATGTADTHIQLAGADNDILRGNATADVDDAGPGVEVAAGVHRGADIQGGCAEADMLGIQEMSDIERTGRRQPDMGCWQAQRTGQTHVLVGEQRELRRSPTEASGLDSAQGTSGTDDDAAAASIEGVPGAQCQVTVMVKGDRRLSARAIGQRDRRWGDRAETAQVDAAISGARIDRRHQRATRLDIEVDRAAAEGASGLTQQIDAAAAYHVAAADPPGGDRIQHAAGGDIAQRQVAAVCDVEVTAAIDDTAGLDKAVGHGEGARAAERAASLGIAIDAGRAVERGGASVQGEEVAQGEADTGIDIQVFRQPEAAETRVDAEDSDGRRTGDIDLGRFAASRCMAGRPVAGGGPEAVDGAGPAVVESRTGRAAKGECGVGQQQVGSRNRRRCGIPESDEIRRARPGQSVGGRGGGNAIEAHHARRVREIEVYRGRRCGLDIGLAASGGIERQVAVEVQPDLVSENTDSLCRRGVNGQRAASADNDVVAGYTGGGEVGRRSQGLDLANGQRAGVDESHAATDRLRGEGIDLVGLRQVDAAVAVDCQLRHGDRGPGRLRHPVVADQA